MKDRFVSERLLWTLLCSLLFLFACSSEDKPSPKSDNEDSDTKNDDTQSDTSKGTEGTGTSSTDIYSTDLLNHPCLSDDPPDDCQLVPSGPACGDGEINQDWEECDDGNSLPGDGCSGACKIEPYYECPVPGEPCIFMLECGNGILEPGEVCDDGNTVDGDGCSSNCMIEPGWICPTAGEPCIATFRCGDGRVDIGEECDDGNTVGGDGCSSDCKLEDGWLCSYPGQPCIPAPRCGDGILQPLRGEVCDDGNNVDGDGCSADCSIVEPGWECLVPGQPCVFHEPVCGDGIVEGDEECDDRNTRNNDGCSSDCKIESGYECPFPGAPCIVNCGDGIVTPPEQCDDGNNIDGDGCSSDCRWEKGWACRPLSGGGYDCIETVCGDGIPWNLPNGDLYFTAKACDDGNTIPFDGCNEFCQLEPDCTGSGCVSVCGDGLVMGDEECDDGNNIDGDGCSADCKIEDGWVCSQPSCVGADCTMRVSVIYRDFSFRHPDFALPPYPDTSCGDGQRPILGMVQNRLNNAWRPVQSATVPQTACASRIGDWFINTISAAGTTGPTDIVVGELILYPDGAGNFVNRYGPNGERWRAPSDTVISNNPCPVGSATCMPCRWSPNQSCSVLQFDGNPLFFPLDYLISTNSLVQNTNPQLSDVYEAKIPEQYGYDGWPWEREIAGFGASLHNFYFTTEVTYWYIYDENNPATLNFTGDDDVWVFVNGRLALDLGGVHVPLDGSVTINRTTAANYGMVHGNVYQINIFHAERKVEGSSFKLTLGGFNTESSVCNPICGDGVVTMGEQCDDGINDGSYGGCNPNCTLGPRCGDASVNGPEECDNGVNNSTYSLQYQGGCARNCVLPPYCGDGNVQSQFGETCDDGVNDFSYGGCTPTCQRGPFCGDGVVTAPEQCDDGVNDGTYGTCNPDCSRSPFCGDGIVQEEWGEQCDGAPVDGKECGLNCRFLGVCGDGVVQEGEECDDGINDGSYGGCNPDCTIGPRCGDGIVQPEYEQCDAGDAGNTGGYGECAPGCVLGPHCGDGIVQRPFEECDSPGSKSCSSACRNIIILK